jgi:hypothetical protein
MRSAPFPGYLNCFLGAQSFVEDLQGPANADLATGVASVPHVLLVSVGFGTHVDGDRICRKSYTLWSVEEKHLGSYYHYSPWGSRPANVLQLH